MINESEKVRIAIEIEADSQTVEAIEFALNEAGAEGIEIDLLGKPQNAETTKIIGYFAEKPDEEIWQSWLQEGLEIYGFEQTRIKAQIWREVENKDWLEEWKKDWKPIEVGNVIVAPHWSEIEENKEKIVIRIEPGMAFGTGTHETTKLCLKAIQENFEAGESFFDVGTGTGILAIAVKKIDAETRRRADTPTEKSKIVGCDIDANSVHIARENAENNRAEGIDFYGGSITEETPEFDFVCANLTIDIIVPLLPLLFAKAKKKLLLSGILTEQTDAVLNELNQKFGISSSSVKIETDGIWISIFVEK